MGTSEKRALFVSASAEPWGAERSLRTLLASRPAGWSCGLLCSSEKVAEFCRPFVAEVLVVPGRQGKLPILREFSRGLRKLGNRYDIVVLFSLKLLPLALIARVASPETRVVADLHGAPTGFDRSVARLLLKTVDGASAISRFVVEHYGIPDIRMIPRPIADSGERKPVSTMSDSESLVVLGIAGRIDTEKRIEVAIDAVRKLPSRFRLHVYGEPYLGGEAYLQQLRQRATDTDRIVFRGYVDPDKIYDEVDAVIVCNENEASGRTIGEAMLREKVAFAPDRGGAQEFFDDTVTGFVYHALDADSLARAIDLAFEAGRDLTLLGSLAREKVISERSPDAVAKEYFGFLGNIVEMGRDRG